MDDDSPSPEALSATSRDEDVLEALVEHSQDPLVYLDRDFDFVRVNRAYAEACRCPPADLIGKNLFDLFPDAERQSIFERVRETGEPAVRREKPFVFPDQPERGVTYWDSTLTRVRGGAGFVLSLRDITAEVAARRPIEESEARFRKLAQELREADRRRSEFMGMLSHEVRNALAAITSSLQVLELAPPTGPAVQRARAVLKRQVAQLARLVDDLLDHTRDANGNIRILPHAVDAGEIVRRVAEDHAALFERREVHLCVDCAPGALPLYADGSRIAQAIGNLLQNAAKFTPPGGSVLVAVSRDDPARQVVVRVADTGMGMTPSMIARLFRPSTHPDETLDRSAGGLGLGLSLVKGIVELHGGEVLAESDGLGRGSRIELRFPLADSAASERALRAGSAPGLRVLLIEDNDDVAQSLRDVLELDGHDVAVAGTGPDGLALALAQPPDVILCDIGLPGMDGYEVARSLRAAESLRNTLLVALTGYTLPEILERATEAGFDAHLAKPVNVGRLDALLARARR